MSDRNKNNFFSWLNTKIKKKDVIDTKKDYIEKDNHNYNDITCTSEKQLMKKKGHPKYTTIMSSNNSNKNSVNNMSINFFSRLKKGLHKTKKFLGDSINHIFLSKKVDDLLFEELEEKMLLADIGIHTTHHIITDLIKNTHRQDLKSSEKVYVLLQKQMLNILKEVDQPLIISHHIPFIILVVGVNGTGKTTTVAKLGKKYKLQGKSVMLAAADTFRAAGIEQLQILGQVNDIPVIAQNFSSDPAAVVFDAIKSAQSKNIDVLIIDTAGRLHNKLHLIEELKKIVRVIKKVDNSGPHETMLIIDACNGQNTIQQTKIFHKALNLTSITITKLDGTAKGGVIFSLANQFKIPIRYIGIGEKTKDLGIFNSEEFIKAIFR